MATEGDSGSSPEPAHAATHHAAPDDRNEGECFGPFHAGLVCRDCADRIRTFETELADRDRRLAQLRTAWDGENEMRRKSEADLAEVVKVRDDFTRRGFHRCGSDTTLCYCAHMDEDIVSERYALKALVKQLEDALQACIDETPAYETD